MFSSSILLFTTICFYSVIDIVVAEAATTKETDEEKAFVYENLRRLGNNNITSIHFIGDLHGDVHCAKHWVQQTKLVDLSTRSNNNTKPKWIGSENDALVFLGDYVDKGSTSSSVLEFVRSLQESFPKNVVTILGNHDFFQVLDSGLYFDYDHEEENALPHPLHHPFYDYSYSFVHPEEYHQSGYLSYQPDNDEILHAILSALQSTYANNMHSQVMMCAPKSACNSKQVDIFTSIPPFKDDTELAERARQRLQQWRKEYAQGLLDSGLLGWMARQPIIAAVGDALIVHGGISTKVIEYAEKVSKQYENMSVSSALHYLTNVPFQEFWEKHIPEMKEANSVKDRLGNDGSYTLQIILDIVQHRGYFKGKGVGCREVEEVIDKIGDGIDRIVVGHTPRSHAEELCSGTLLASDSSLSRSFRAYGNFYCPLDDDARRKLTIVNEERGSNEQLFSQCGQPPNDACEGSISRIRRTSSSEPWPRSVELMKSSDFTSEAEKEKKDYKDEEL